MTTTVRLALDDIARKIAEELHIEGDFERAELDGDSLVATFSRRAEASHDDLTSVRVVDDSKRVRTKRKGWEVVGRIVNKKGQTVAIYRPFVDALAAESSEDGRQEAVRRILRANGNNPTDATVRYYLQNTLEYLAQKGAVKQ